MAQGGRPIVLNHSFLKGEGGVYLVAPQQVDKVHSFRRRTTFRDNCSVRKSNQEGRSPRVREIRPRVWSNVAKGESPLRVKVEEGLDSMT